MTNLKIQIFILFCLLQSACVHEQVKFRKAQLLDPMMDVSKSPAAVDRLSGDHLGQHENASIGISSGLGGGCPTCGG